MDFSLRQISEGDAGQVQRLYAAAAGTFSRLLGRPAGPGQAERDIAQAQATPGRYQLGAMVDGELAGLIDLKLSAEDMGEEKDSSPEPGASPAPYPAATKAHIGLLLFPDLAAHAELAALALSVLARWLRASAGVRRIEASVPAADAEQIAFWQTQGYEPTGESYRRQLQQYAPRFLVVARDLSPGNPGRPPAPDRGPSTGGPSSSGASSARRRD